MAAKTKKTLTKAEQKEKEERLLRRRAKREEHEAIIAKLKSKEELWESFLAFRGQLEVLNGDASEAVRHLFVVLKNVARARARKPMSPDQRAKLEERLARMKAKAEELETRLG